MSNTRSWRMRATAASPKSRAMPARVRQRQQRPEQRRRHDMQRRRRLQRRQHARDHFAIRQGFATRQCIGTAMRGRRVERGERRLCEVVGVHRLAQPGRVARQHEAMPAPRDAGDARQRAIAGGAVDQRRPQQGRRRAARAGSLEHHALAFAQARGDIALFRDRRNPASPRCWSNRTRSRAGTRSVDCAYQRAKWSSGPQLKMASACCGKPSA